MFLRALARADSIDPGFDPDGVLFGVLSHTVSQRTREIGTRMAPGAGAGVVHGLVIGQGLRLTATGLGIGCLLALAAAQAIRGLLFGISPADPVAFGSIILVFSVAGLLASWLPARSLLQTSEKTCATFELTVTNPGGQSPTPKWDNAICELAPVLKNIETYELPARANDARRACCESRG